MAIRLLQTAHDAELSALDDAAAISGRSYSRIDIRQSFMFALL